MLSGTFLFNQKSHDINTFVMLLMKWSIGGNTYAKDSIKKYVPELERTDYPVNQKPFDVLVWSYIFSVNLVSASIAFELPVNIFLELKRKLIWDFVHLKMNASFDERVIELFGKTYNNSVVYNDLDLAEFDEIVDKYTPGVYEWIGNKSHYSYGPMGDVFSDILFNYDIPLDSVSGKNKDKLSKALNKMLDIALNDFRKLDPVYII